MHACVGSSAELQIATLTVMRQLVVQPQGPDAFLEAQAIPLLATLQHALVAEIKILATRILDKLAGSSRAAQQTVGEEQAVQVLVTLQPAALLLRTELNSVSSTWQSGRYFLLGLLMGPAPAVGGTCTTHCRSIVFMFVLMLMEQNGSLSTWQLSGAVPQQCKVRTEREILHRVLPSVPPKHGQSCIDCTTCLSPHYLCVATWPCV